MTPAESGAADVEAIRGSWSALKRVVVEALDLPAGARHAHLEARCPDSAQRAEAIGLLRACEQAETSPVFKLSAAEFAAVLLTGVDEEQAGVLEALRAALAGRYAIERELGRGGMATVYLARDERHGRPVALKLLRPELVPDDGPSRAAARFHREIELAARLSHPHILPLYDSGAADGLLYYVTPYIDGESLRSRLKRSGRLPLPESLGVLRDVARALAYAHRQGLVHRDIKPANILLSQEGDALVADFGVAKALAAAQGVAGTQEAELTEGALILGTPAYMAPEQVIGDPGIDHRADLYALGAVGYELLTGAPPFAGRPRHEQLAAHLSEMPSPVSVRQPDLPEMLAALVDRLLSKRPADRPRDADEVIRLLDAAMTEPVRTARDSTFTGGFGDECSIAVLPFEATSGSLEEAAFGEGLADQLIRALGGMSGVHVAAPASAAALKRRGLDVRTIGERAGVATALEGRVHRDGDRLQVAVNLIRTSDGRPLWSKSYEASAQDLFGLQEQVTRDVAAAVSPGRGAEPPPDRLTGRGTEDREAYELYLRGRYLANTRQRDGLLRALAYYEEALGRDPAYARAHAGIGDAWTFLGLFAHVPPHDAFPKARAAAKRAIALDSRLVEGHATLAHLLVVYEWDWEAAESALERAIAVDPRYPELRMYYASFLHSFGRSEEALTQLDLARELDPLTPTGLLRGRIYVNTRRPDAAIRVLQEEIELDPRRDLAHQLLAHAHLQKGSSDEAIASMRRAAALSGPRDSAQLAYVYAVTGHEAEARRVLAELRERGEALDQLGFHLAMAYAGLGDSDEAFRWLEKAYDQHASFMSLLAVSTGFESIRSDPRFGRLLQRMGLD